MAALPLRPSDEIATLRASLRSDRASLEQDFLKHGKAARLLGAHSRLIDDYLRRVWQMLGMPGNIALVAVGGYGRGELYPKSDIDLLILLDAESEKLMAGHPPDEALQHKLHELVQTLWDIGLEVGHSIRTVEHCLQESADITVQTNLLESRLLAGDASLFESLRAAVQQHLDPYRFFLAKQHEQQQRHARFAEADYNLEPNLKESPGGLRDLQTVTWIALAAGLGTRWSELAKAGLITATEARQIARHDELLQTLRVRLHYLAKRREDRLLFDFQTMLAEQMGIEASANRRASEHLMQRYYRTRLAVRQFNTILLQNLHDRLVRETPPQHALNERFRVIGTLLDIRDEQLFEHTPAAIFELFLLMEQLAELTDLSAKTLRALWRAQHKVDAAFRRDPLNRQRFMEILRQPTGVIHALRRMNQYGILGRYIPAFGRIVGQMQHDLFHVYTVDEHILMVVRNLRRFALEKHAHEVPLCSKLMAEFARPEVLYIAGLFHDIAKGRGGDHSQLGMKDARAFCKQHGLGNDDSDLVVWLVGQHLALSATAQKQDLSDPEVIASFSRTIRNDRYLVALYLLTVADIRGTSPKVWNAWKAKLMEDLFLATRRYLAGGQAADHLDEIRREAANTLNLYALTPDTYRMLWAQLDDSYFLDHEAQEIAWHTRQLAFKANADAPIVKARLSRAGEGLQVMVYCRDQRGLFARICDFFARMNYTIAEAKIHTTRHGYALNSFQIMEAARSETAYRDIMTYIEFELAQQIAQARPVSPAAGGRVSRQLKHFPIPTEVEIALDNKGMHVLSLVAGDRPGLLARIALILDRHDVRLHRAKINTLGSRAEDVFWVSSSSLADEAKVAALKNELLKV
ncbi:bifunctional uridylyltransferase/uridylyl-removing enzyme [Ferrigenium kumadai]|uniref:Bifunctional uridylyltransferase/uridylyl-removing enzyme n=1 Tax=Ferrigenium kumadai TaxID=1682490 RepID=A0AAN1W0A5_9PROT|nr:[protein-PII] uridylyltransferase [Ferrigenium kumadai]BBI99441.1 bifunctional uridylyltransferase/uridylyl-removing enzyme [Ferrigenium kumadai]